MRPLCLVPLAFVALTPLAAQDKPAVQWIAPSGPAAASLPFSPAVRVGNLLYLSGQLGTDSTGLVSFRSPMILNSTELMIDWPGDERWTPVQSAPARVIAVPPRF